MGQRTLERRTGGRAMIAKIYYQDFSLNVMALEPDQLVLEKENSQWICNIDTQRLGMCLEREILEEPTKEQFAEGVFRLMNLAPVKTAGHSSTLRFKAIRHTSMSVGDYIEFEDGEIWIAGTVGWKVVKSPENKKVVSENKKG